MNFIKPADENNFLVVCEKCKAIINFSREDCYCVKEADMIALNNKDFKNITRVLIDCPNCCYKQDIISGLKYAVNDWSCWSNG